MFRVKPGDDDVRITLWDRILTVGIVAVFVYALLLVGAGGVAAGIFDRLGFGPTKDGLTAGPERDYVVFIIGVLGAVILGWMALLLWVVSVPLRRREPWAWSAVMSSVAVWFIADTGLSLAPAYWAHAAFNVLFLLILGGPLMMLRTELTVSASRPAPTGRGSGRPR